MGYMGIFLKTNKRKKENKRKKGRKRKRREESYSQAVHAFNPITWKAEAGRFPSSRPAWSSEFQDSQSYIEKPCLEKSNQIKILYKVKSWR